jgi:glyoxylase-like metal-dependent hydrolase (beta-lactamase superfamily II)
MLSIDYPQTIDFTGFLEKVLYRHSHHGINFSQIRGVFISHCHPDHAGTLELLRRHEVQTLIMERHMPYIAGLNKFFKEKKNDPGGNYISFDESTAMSLSLDAARLFLSDLGINGKMVHTPGHSDDSYSLLIGKAVFIGDLSAFNAAEGYGETVTASWRNLIADRARTIYPAHGIRYEIETSLPVLH